MRYSKKAAERTGAFYSGPPAKIVDSTMSRWRRVCLGSVLRPRREKVHPSTVPDARFIGMEHIEAHSTRLLETSPAYGMRSSANRFYRGDVLYGRLRPYLNKVHAPNFSGICSAEFIVFPETEGIDSGFLKYRINAADFAQFATHLNAGDRPRVDFDQLAEFEIFLPPIDEQQRMVAEIEKQFTRLDAGVAALQSIRAKLKRYRASVLKAACEGRLVPTEAELARKENRSYESAAQLLSKTQAPARPNRWNSRSKDVIPGHAALAVGNPQTTLPEGWAWSALVEIAKMESGHTPSREHPEWWEGTIPWIGIADAREHDSELIHDTFQHTNPEGIKNSASRVLASGTVCISRTASVGYVVVMAREMATSQDFVNWVPTTAVAADWLRAIFSADREVLRRFGKGSVHKTIYFPEWLSIHIAVPPLAEQHRIVAEVDRRLSVINELQVIVSSNLRRSVSLRQSILQWAFCGKVI